MELLLSFVVFAVFVSGALTTYRLWRQQNRPEHGLHRIFVVAVLLFAVFLFHATLRELAPAAAHRKAVSPQAMASRGHQVIEKLGCSDCHSIGGGVIVGPDLQLAATKYDHDTLVRFIEDPQTIYAARRQHPLNKGFMEMPSLNVNGEDAEAIAAYLDSAKPSR